MAVVLVRMKLVPSLSSIQELYHRTESVYLMENVNDSYVSIVTSAVILEHASLCGTYMQNICVSLKGHLV